MKKYETDDRELSDDQLKYASDFHYNLIKLINNYKNKGLNGSLIVNDLYNVVIDISKKYAIEVKAMSLGIDKGLYKNEMRLLFKGKI
jgi:hypothetical protein